MEVRLWIAIHHYFSFSKSEILSQFTQIQIEKIAQNAKISNFKAGQVIYNKGDLCDRLIIVLEGNIIDPATSK